MKLWKVFSMKNGNLISARAPKVANVIYPEGEWTEAPEWLRKRGYHLLAFTSKKQAGLFSWVTNSGLSGLVISKYDTDIIREVEAEGVYKPNRPICDLRQSRYQCGLTTGGLNAIGLSKELKKWGRDVILKTLEISWPEGTRFCKRIKVTAKK